MNTSIKEKGLKKKPDSNKMQQRNEINYFWKSTICSWSYFLRPKTPVGYPASAQVISAGDIQPNTKPFSTRLI